MSLTFLKYGKWDGNNVTTACDARASITIVVLIIEDESQQWIHTILYYEYWCLAITESAFLE